MLKGTYWQIFIMFLMISFFVDVNKTLLYKGLLLLCGLNGLVIVIIRIETRYSTSCCNNVIRHCNVCINRCSGAI